VKSVLFTYYSNLVQDIFLENVEAMIRNSQTDYDEIVICSQIEVPLKHVISLSKKCKVTRVFPNYASQQIKKENSQSNQYKIDPFIFSALSYMDAIVTVFDPHIFILKPIPAYSNRNIFYRTHSGLICPHLFTIVNTDATSKLLSATITGPDLVSDIGIKKFTYTLTNGIQFSSDLIYDKFLVFDNPAQSDQLIVDRLLALNFREALTSQEVHKQMFAVRKTELPKVSTLTKIKTKASDAIFAAFRQDVKSNSPDLTELTPTILFKYFPNDDIGSTKDRILEIIENCSCHDYWIVGNIKSSDPLFVEFSNQILSINSDKMIRSLDELETSGKTWDIVYDLSSSTGPLTKGFDTEIRHTYLNSISSFSKTTKLQSDSVDPTESPAMEAKPSDFQFLSRIRKSTERKSLSPLLISYYSDFRTDGYYRAFAMQLIKKCEEFKINFDISELSPRGGYTANCLMKPEFILDKMMTHKRSIIWMDCDTDFREPFSEFNNLFQDIGLATHSGDMNGIQASPVFLNYTEGSFKIVREWIVHCNSAFENGIPELDHDALKHYVLEKLNGQYSVFLLSDNWLDFVNGKYINNGNSEIPGKDKIHQAVQSLTHQARWNLSKSVKTVVIKISDSEPDPIKLAYSAVLNFSNHSRLKVYLPIQQLTQSSDEITRLKIESGGELYYGQVSLHENEVLINIDSNSNLQKNWDKLYAC
jgi:hypothetical protein